MQIVSYPQKVLSETLLCDPGPGLKLRELPGSLQLFQGVKLKKRAPEKRKKGSKGFIFL